MRLITVLSFLIVTHLFAMEYIETDFNAEPYTRPINQTNAMIVWYKFNQNNSLLLTVHENGNAHVWNIPPKNGQQSIKIASGEEIEHGGFFHNGDPTQVTLIYKNGERFTWNGLTGDPIEEKKPGVLDRMTEAVYGAAKRFNGAVQNFIATSDDSDDFDDSDDSKDGIDFREIRIGDLEEKNYDDNKLRANLAGLEKSVDEPTIVHTYNNGSFVLNIYSDGSCYVMDGSGQKSKAIGHESQNINLAYFSNENRDHVILISDTGKESTWNMVHGTQIVTKNLRDEVVKRPDF